jgi:hypothetical protein
MSAPLLRVGAGWAAEQSIAADGLLRGLPLYRSAMCLKELHDRSDLQG